MCINEKIVAKVAIFSKYDSIELQIASAECFRIAKIVTLHFFRVIANAVKQSVVNTITHTRPTKG
jgi:hypothetical protein